MRAPVTKAVAALVLVGGAAFAFSALSAPAPQRHEAQDHTVSGMIGDARSAAHPGDVIFKSGGGLWGRLAAEFSDSDKSYGHVGIVVIGEDGALGVVHAGGDPVSREGRVMTDSFDEFLAASERAALYRPRIGAGELGALIAYAHAASARRAPFDTSFSLDTEDQLYCTELVWRAFLAAGTADPVPAKNIRSGKTYVALDSLQASALLEPVWRSP